MTLILIIRMIYYDGDCDENVNLRKPEAHKALQNLMVEHAMAHKDEVVSHQIIKLVITKKKC